MFGKVFMNLLLRLVLLCAWIAPGQAATFTVTDPSDSGPGTLRDAIAQANATPGSDSINLVLNLGRITLTSGALRITSPMEILNQGNPLDSWIDGNGDRIFDIGEDPATAPSCPATTTPADYAVRIVGVTLVNGRAADAGSGGAIRSRHSLVLDGTSFLNNAAEQGGAVSFLAQYPNQSLTVITGIFQGNTAKPLSSSSTAINAGGALYVGENCEGARTAPLPVTITRSSFRGNHVEPVSSGVGGAIATISDADVSIFHSVISGNGVTSPGTLAPGTLHTGGGIYAAARSVRLERMEIAANSAEVGGALSFSNVRADSQAPTLAMAAALVNVTVSGNIAAVTGGGIEVLGNVALNVYNSTVSSNSASASGAGGIQIAVGGTTQSGAAAAPTVALVSSIVAANVGEADIRIGPPMSSLSLNADYSLIKALGTGITLNGSGNVIGRDPLLGPLANNGGSSILVRTQALLPGSPAINAGSNPLNLVGDQRGASFPRVVNGVADIGAFESAFAPAGSGTVPIALYRFNTGTYHFYTGSEAEKSYVEATFPSWTLEGVAYYVYETPQANTLPVYRFNTGSYHFYTISQSERDYVVANFPSWVLEGVAFYTYQNSVAQTLPVYRFNTGLDHFYTISEGEKAYALATFPDWILEGVAYYARESP
jgi:hypothetical protein